MKDNPSLVPLLVIRCLDQIRDCVAKFLSSSKRNAFYNRTRVKRAKSVPVFSSRVGLCCDYMLLFDELKNFATQPFWVPGTSG